MITALKYAGGGGEKEISEKGKMEEGRKGGGVITVTTL